MTQQWFPDTQDGNKNTCYSGGASRGWAPTYIQRQQDQDKYCVQVHRLLLLLAACTRDLITVALGYGGLFTNNKSEDKQFRSVLKSSMAQIPPSLLRLPQYVACWLPDGYSSSWHQHAFQSARKGKRRQRCSSAIFFKPWKQQLLRSLPDNFHLDCIAHPQ